VIIFQFFFRTWRRGAIKERERREGKTGAWGTHAHVEGARAKKKRKRSGNWEEVGKREGGKK